MLCSECGNADQRVARRPRYYVCRACALERDVDNDHCTEEEFDSVFPRGCWPPHRLALGWADSGAGLAKPDNANPLLTTPCRLRR